MRIHIEPIPAKAIRHDQAGDWQFRNGDLYIQVAETGNDTYTFLLGLHETIEACLCKAKGIAETDVDNFDVAFEHARKFGVIGNLGEGSFFGFNGRRVPVNAEAGDQPDSPYRSQHAIATLIERLLARELKVDWDGYESALNKLT